MKEFKGRDVAFVSDWLKKRVFERSLLKTSGVYGDCYLVGYDRQIGHHFGPRGREFEQVQRPRALPGGGEGVDVEVLS